MATKKQVTAVGFKLTEDEAERLKVGHSNLGQGARIAVRLYPAIRQDVVSTLKKTFTDPQLLMLSNTPLIKPCTKRLLIAVTSEIDEDLSALIETLSRIDVIVLVDMIEQGMLEAIIKK